MNKKKVCFVAQFPPPIHGLSKAVDTLYNSYLHNEFDFEKVNITDNKKFLSSIFKILKSNADLFYFTISQTKGGNIRDLIIFKIIELKNKKCLVHLHGGYYRKLVESLGSFQKRLNYKAIHKLDGVIVLGDSLKPIFEGMIDESKIFVVPNCVDNEFVMSGDDFKDKLNNTDGIINVLYLSNFIREKGYRQVLDIAKLAKDKGDCRFRFDFAGNFFEEEERNYFISFVHDNALDDIVTYHGVVKGKDKAELLKKANVFMLLTRYPNEGQPISVLEAMANAAVIVTTDHAGIPDIAKDGVNGVVLQNNSENDTESLYNKLRTALENNYMDIIKNNRTEVLNKYTEKIYLENLGKLFGEV